MDKSKKILLTGAIASSVFVFANIGLVVYYNQNINNQDWQNKIQYSKSFAPIDNDSVENIQLDSLNIRKNIRMFVKKDDISWKKKLERTSFSKYVDNAYQTYWDEFNDVVYIDFVGDQEDENKFLEELAKISTVFNILFNVEFVPSRIVDDPDVKVAKEHANLIKNKELFKDVYKRYANPLLLHYYSEEKNIIPSTVKIGIIEVDSISPVDISNKFKNTTIKNYDYDYSSNLSIGDFVINDAEYKKVYGENNEYKTINDIFSHNKHSLNVSLLAAGEHSLNTKTELHFVSLKHEFTKKDNKFFITPKFNKNLFKQIDAMINNGVKIINNSYSPNLLSTYKLLADEIKRDPNSTKINYYLKILKDPKYDFWSPLDEFIQHRSLYTGTTFVVISGNSDVAIYKKLYYLEDPQYEKINKRFRTVNDFSDFFGISVGANDSKGIKKDYSSYINKESLSDQPLPLVTALSGLENWLHPYDDELEGTSFSAPIVTNIISFLLSYNKTINENEKFRTSIIKSLLSVSSIRYDQPDFIHTISKTREKYIAKDVIKSNYSDMVGAGEISLNNLINNLDNIFYKHVKTKKTWYGSRKQLDETEITRFEKNTNGTQKLKVSISWMPELNSYTFVDSKDLNKNAHKFLDDLDFKVQYFNSSNSEWEDIIDYDQDKLANSNIEMKIKEINRKGTYRILVKEVKRNTTRNGFYIGGAYEIK